MTPSVVRVICSGALLLALGGLSSCTLHHSKQALYVDTAGGAPPPNDARFVTEEDSGLSIFGLFMLAEPDHYAVLLERLRRDHRCGRLLYPQLDFYTDHWFLIAFPIARITSLCEPVQDEKDAIPALPPAPGWHDAPAPTPAASSNGAAVPAPKPPEPKPSEPEP